MWQINKKTQVSILNDEMAKRHDSEKGLQLQCLLCLCEDKMCSFVMCMGTNDGWWISTMKFAYNHKELEQCYFNCVGFYASSRLAPWIYIIVNVCLCELLYNSKFCSFNLNSIKKYCRKLFTQSKFTKWIISLCKLLSWKLLLYLADALQSHKPTYQVKFDIISLA